MFGIGNKPAKHAVKGGKKKPFGGYQIQPDEKLGAILGNNPVTPAEMTKKLWAYIKKHNLASKG